MSLRHGQGAPAYGSVAQTVEALKQHGKPQRGAPAYSRFINRPLGRLIAAVAYRLGLTPDAVTGISAGFSAMGMATLVVGGDGLWVGPVVAVLLMTGYAFDSADGQVARLSGGGSSRGEWLDHVVDCVKIGTLHLAVAWALYLKGSPAVWIAVAVLYAVVGNVFFFTFVLTDLLRRLDALDGSDPTSSSPPQAAPVLRSLAAAPTDYGLLCLLFIAWGWAPVFRPAYSLLMAGTALYVLLGAPRWYRSLAPLAR